MKRLYTFSSLQQVSGIKALHAHHAAASTLPRANASFAQQIPFSLSHKWSSIL